jgi:hypothetical protein
MSLKTFLIVIFFSPIFLTARNHQSEWFIRKYNGSVLFANSTVKNRTYIVAPEESQKPVFSSPDSIKAQSFSITILLICRFQSKVLNYRALVGCLQIRPCHNR